MDTVFLFLTIYWEYIPYGIGFMSILILYFFPCAVAAGRTNNQIDISFFWTNLLSGWTVIGWVICLVWAYKIKPKDNDIKNVSRS